MRLVEKVRRKYVVASRISRYLAMFNFLTDAKDLATVKSTIQSMEKAFRTHKDKPAREDAVIWAVRIYRDMKRVKKTSGPSPEEKAYHLMRDKLQSIHNILREAGDNNISSILNYRFAPDAPVEKVFKDLESRYKEWQEADIGEDRILEKGNETLIKFSDGWQWQDIPEGACEKEGDAMRHCGNVPSVQDGDRLLSLREPIQKGKKKGWKPQATFILHKGGMLGEMKGYANNKPKANLHKYIVKLLESDDIKGIDGGGYEPREKFAMNDLSEAERNALYEKKPELMPLREQFERHGLTPTVERGLARWGLSNRKDDFEYDKDGKPTAAIVKRYKNLHWFAENEDTSLREALNAMDEHIEVESSWDLADIWSNLSSKEETAVIERILDLHKDAIVKWNKKYNKENPDDASDDLEVTVKMMLDQGDLEDVKDELISAGHSATERGYSERRFRDIQERLANYKLNVDYDEGGAAGDADLNVGDTWDSPVTVTMPIGQVLDHAEIGADGASFEPSDTSDILSGESGDPSDFLYEEIMERLPEPEKKRKRA